MGFFQKVVHSIFQEIVENLEKTKKSLSSVKNCSKRWLAGGIHYQKSILKLIHRINC